MTALEWWESCGDAMRWRIASRVHPMPTVEEIFQPFYRLPIELKAAILDSEEWRNS